MSTNFMKRANRRVLGAAAVSTAFLVPLGVFGAPALARSAASASQYQYGGSSQYQYKITICHHTHSKKHPMHTIRVSVNSWKAHQKHGDTLGACPAPAASSSASSNANHGKSGENHGKSDTSHGNNGKGHH